MTKHKNNFFVFFAVMVSVAIILFVSCTSSINGAFNAGNKLEISLNGAFLPRITALIKKLSESGSDVLIDAKRINKSLSAISGIENVDFKNSGGRIIGKFTINNADRFFSINVAAAANGANNTKTANGVNGAGAPRQIVTRTISGNSTHYKIYLDKELGGALVSTLLPELQAYLSAIAAPIATGETLGKDEYLDTVKDIYGVPLSQEIAGSTITVKLSFPSKVKSAAGKNITSSGNSVTINMPLVDILVLDKDLNYDIYVG